MAAPMSHRTDDLRIKWTKETSYLPFFSRSELPITERAESTILQARKEIVDILAGKRPSPARDRWSVLHT